MSNLFGALRRALLLLTTPTVPACAQSGMQLGDPRALADLDAYVVAAMRTWQVPGLAIAIVRGDSVIHVRGYGERTLGDADAVDAHTVFPIGSATKPFTAAAVGVLVSEGLARWDDPVARHLPDLRLADPALTSTTTVRDLLAHRTGLVGGDLLWLATGYTQDEILRRWRHLRPVHAPRTRFVYENIPYLAAGRVVAAASGMSWDDFVHRRLLTPLGMTRSSTSVRALEGAANVASAHHEVDGTLRVVPHRDLANIAPAGALNASASDMARWVRFQLAEGRIDGRSLVDAAVMREMHRAQIDVPRDATWRLLAPGARSIGYGLGWYVHDYRGVPAVQHGGWIDGASAAVTLLPTQEFGVVVLANVTGTLLTRAITNRILDLHLGVRPRDWSADLHAAVRTGEARSEARAADATPRDARAASVTAPLERYAAVFTDSLLGDLTVRRQAGGLVAQLGRGAVADLEPDGPHSFVTRWRDPFLGESRLAFAVDAGGTVRAATLRTGGSAITFERAAPAGSPAAAAIIPRASYDRYVGSFRSRWGRWTVTVRHTASGLELQIPDQPAYLLVPVDGTRFRITGPGAPEGFHLQYTFSDGRMRRVTIERSSPRSTTVLLPVDR